LHDPALKRDAFEFDARLNGGVTAAGKPASVDSTRGSLPRTSPSGITILVKNKPFRHVLGSGGVVRGWEAAVGSMALGEKATFRLSPDAGYGSAGKGSAVPPGSGLEYDMELVGVDGKFVCQGLVEVHSN
jgi:hypothetical protein